MLGSPTLTLKGRNLLAKIVAANRPLTLSNIGLGDGLQEENESVTTLVNEIMKKEIESCKYNENEGQYYVRRVFTNEELDEGFYIREVGIYAIDPDEGEILYAYTNGGENGVDYFAPGTGKVIIKEIIEMATRFGNAEEINITIDPSVALVTNKEFEEYKKTNKEDINNLQEQIDENTAQLNDMMYETAGGTGTAITLSMLTLKNGYSKTFIATANNNGSATTINGKPLYKPGTTTAPNIKEGKAYTVWYNSVSDCFFLQASAEGNVGAEHVLAGYTFSNDDDTGLVGAMPNNTGTNKELSLNETWVIPKGYHDGNGRVTQNIPNNGAINANLNCGESKDIPAGYTNGGRITANSLASQTPANATAAQILNGYTAWVNGNLITGNAMKAKSIATIETITRNGIGWTAGGTVEITFNTPFDILLVGSYIIVNNGQLQMNYLPVFSDNRIVLSISNDRRTLYMRNTNTSCGWNSTIFLFSINYKE